VTKTGSVRTGLIFLRGYVLFRDTIRHPRGHRSFKWCQHDHPVGNCREISGSGGQDVFTDNRKSMYALGLSHHTGGNL
jgi:hypothetical protein